MKENDVSHDGWSVDDFYRAVVIADSGDLRWSTVVGWEYARGELVAQDLKEAEKYMRKAASAHDVEVLFEVGKFGALYGIDDLVACLSTCFQRKYPPAGYVLAVNLIRKNHDESSDINGYLSDSAALDHIPSQMLLRRRFGSRTTVLRKILLTALNIISAIRLVYISFINPKSLSIKI